MRKRYKVLLAAVGIAVILTTILASTVLAAPPRTGYTGQDANVYPGWCHGVNLQAVSDLLGLTPEEIWTQLREGKSLVAIAEAQGVSEDELVQAILAPRKEFIQQRVTAGILTQEQADKQLKGLEQGIRQSVETKGLGATNRAFCGYGSTGQGQGVGPGGWGMGGMMRGWGGTGFGPGVGGGMMGRWGRTY